MKRLYYCRMCRKIFNVETNKCPICKNVLNPLKDKDKFVCDKCNTSFTMSEVFGLKHISPIKCMNNTCDGHIILEDDKIIPAPYTEFGETIIGGLKKIPINYKKKDHRGLENEDILKDGDNYYKILSKINEGGLSFIYLAEDLSNNEKIIVKAFKYSKYWNPDTKTNDCEKFWIRESKITQLQSASSLKCMHYYGRLKLDDWDPPEYYLFLEYIPGENLQKWMTTKFGTQKQIPLNQVFELIEKIGIPLLKHLDYCHNVHCIIHRDISPLNILIVPKSLTDYYPILIDWGVSKDCNKEKIFHPPKDYLDLPPTGTSIDNGFTAPENRKGLDPLAATDIYMMGIILSFLMTNTLPKAYPGTTEEYIIHPQRLDVKLPKDLCSIIEKMTQHRPADRYNNLNDVIHAFENFLLTTKLQDDVKTVKADVKQTLVASDTKINVKVHTNFAIVIDFYQIKLYQWKKNYDPHLLKFVNLGYQCMEVDLVKGKGFQYFIFHTIQKGVTNVQIDCVDESKKIISKFQYIITIE